MFGMKETEPVRDYAALLRDVIGWGDDLLISAPPPERKIDGLLWMGNGGGPLLAARSGLEKADRFRIARALSFWLQSGGEEMRLLTRSHNWDQRASRAFAAEFLAPSGGLRSMVGDEIDSEDISSLASKYNVSPHVIIHQIENHGIGWV